MTGSEALLAAADYPLDPRMVDRLVTVDDPEGYVSVKGATGERIEIHGKQKGHDVMLAIDPAEVEWLCAALKLVAYETRSAEAADV